MRTVFLLASLALALSAAFPAAGETPAPLAAYACGGCHGVGAQGAGGVPALAGRPKDEIVSAMAAFRSGERPGTIMGRIARGYSEVETAAIAASLSATRPATR